MSEYLTLPRRSKRTRLEIALEILVVLRKGTLKHSSLMRKVGVCHEGLLRIVPILVANKYINVQNTEYKWYCITDEGLKAIPRLQNIIDFKEVSRL